MKLPGFTAEGALGKPSKTYRTFRSSAPGTQNRVGPAAVFPAQLEDFDDEMGEEMMADELDETMDMDDEDIEEGEELEEGDENGDDDDDEGEDVA